MESERAERLAEGVLAPERLTPGERVLAALARKSVVAPARLGPRDLDPVREHFGLGGALELTAVLGSFHFINRVADLVGIVSDLPLVTPRFAALRRWSVRFQGWAMGKLADFSNRPVELDVPAALAEAESALGPLAPGYAAVTYAPNVAGFLATVARVARELDPAMRAQVARAVADALPANEEQATGFHPRPSDPVDALAFVGTRYVVRTTDRMLDAVREKTGWEDAELTDLFYAISMQNAFERMDRLLAEPLAP